MSGRIAAVLLLAATLAATLLAKASVSGSPRETVARYLAALEARDWPAAEACWRRVDLERSRRLGTRFEGLPLKIDGESPLGRAAGRGLSRASAGEPRAHSLSATLDTALTAVHAVARGAGGEALAWDYLLLPEDGRWRLAHPVGLALELAAARGEVLDGRWLRAAVAPRAPGRPALAALDAFVDGALERLDVPADRRAALERGRFELLFAPADWVEALAGAPTVGVANLQLDCVVTRHPDHEHELAHLLDAFRLEDAPLWTLPALQEGFAVALGGRWGRSPAALEPVGRWTFSSGFVSLDDLLPRPAFLRLGADLSYAPAGLLVGWLLESLGPAEFSALRTRLSAADPADLDTLGAATLRAELGRALDGADPAEELDSDFADWLGSRPPNPLAPLAERPSGAPVRRLETDGLACELWLDGDLVVAEFRDEAGGVPAGALRVESGGADGSALHGEHFPAEEVAASGALRVTGGEAGWYDYGRDQLLLKRIAQFEPEPPFLAADGALRLAWPAAALPWPLAEAPLRLVRAEVAP